MLTYVTSCFIDYELPPSSFDLESKLHRWCFDIFSLTANSSEATLVQVPTFSRFLIWWIYCSLVKHRHPCQQNRCQVTLSCWSLEKINNTNWNFIFKWKDVVNTYQHCFHPCRYHLSCCHDNDFQCSHWFSWIY